MTNFKVLCYMLSEIEKTPKNDKNLFPQGIGTYGLDITNLDHPRMETKMMTKDNKGKISYGKAILGGQKSGEHPCLTVTSNNIEDLKGVKYTMVRSEEPIVGKYAAMMPTEYSVIAEDISGRKQHAKGYYARYAFTTDREDLSKGDMTLLYDYTSGLFPNHPDIKKGGSKKKSLKKKNH